VVGVEHAKGSVEKKDMKTEIMKRKRRIEEC
jgi:hypothetical protein